MTGDTLVVGVDGSAPSYAALRWAAAEAVRQSLPLRVVTAYYPAVAGYEPIGAAGVNPAAHARKVLDEALAEVVTPGLVVTGVCAVGAPAHVLLNASRQAVMAVVGSRGHSGLAAALLGATSVELVTHAACPVVVVRGRGDEATGPVVVGFDGSRSAANALDVAFEQAQARCCELTVIRTYAEPSVLVGRVAADDIDDRLLAELHGAVAARSGRYPQVSVHCQVDHGNPAEYLLEASRTAQLLVVGTRGHGGFAGLLLGSVGLHLVNHADCPVLVVREAPLVERVTAGAT